MEHQLPNNATNYERVLASQVERLLELDTDRIKHLWDPWKCHIDDLPYLAWSMSVDLWNDKWDETKKRQVVADSLALHRLKGTEEGIRRHIAVVGSKLLRTVAPPARGYYTPVMTDAGRKKWLEDLPQIRIYPFLTKRNAPKKRAFYRGPAGSQAFLKSAELGVDAFFQASDGSKNYGRRATFYDRGVEIPAQYEVLQEDGGAIAERVAIRRMGRRRNFYGTSFFDHAFYQASDAEDNIISVRLSEAASRQYASFSGSKVTDVRPERIYQGRIAPVGRRFYGRRKGFYLSTFAPNLIFDRITILDKTRLGERKKVRSFWGHTRYGIKPFTAELLVEVPIVRSKPRMGTYIRGFWKKADLSKLQHTMEAIRTSKSFRDTILVDTQVHRMVRLRDVPKLGTFKLGEVRRLA
ncbi:phage tail protein I [Methylobacterium sp. WL120]|uniref:phage tail protein I n=1 Tax=Methylobacterium sp. WL120 TaxID=2603887 RepID=UPI001AEE569E|nr:phage tail protein I [Methylobacterium sp. WL120]